MGGDYARFTFDASKGYSGVHEQQGRVTLDADFNEFEEILDRRGRAQMYDTVGPAVVPATTRSGFKIELAGEQITINPGRAYVDGITVECFGDRENTLTPDNALGGVHGGPLDYEKQPFRYELNYPTLSAPAANFVDLVYLDVWQREVTVAEDWDLREPALGGPDTATRVQTAWQVKILREVDLEACAADHSKWKSLVAPSTGTLSTTTTTPAKGVAGSCVVNPASGYTRTENHLYRVEIHQTGKVGDKANPVLFKWSRDNASLTARVEKITAHSSGSTIEVSSTGPDSWRRFEKGHQIEFLNDGIEYAMRESGKGGEMVEVVEVNHATGEIIVNRDLTTVFQSKPDSHPRIRLWETAPLTAKTGKEKHGLENGIVITFGAGTLHAGDYWVFAARAATDKIEELHNAPPRGILHHFAKLALIADRKVKSDCRVPWPTHCEGCCTAVVEPGEDIQKAIDSLTGKGGCVCLKMGVHVITKPLSIRQGDLTLHGEVPWVTVRLASGGPRMLSIEAADAAPLRNVSVTGIQFEARNSTTNQSMILVRGLTGGGVAECGLEVSGRSRQGHAATGVELLECADLELRDNTLVGFDTGIAGGLCEQIRVLGNRLSGTTVPVTPGEPASASRTGIDFVANDDVRGIQIERNVLTDYRRGIQLTRSTVVSPGPPAEPAPLGMTAAGCRIVANVIARRGAPTDSSLVASGIAAHVSRCEITENAITITGFGEHGIIASGGSLLVERNEIRSSAVLPREKPDPALPPDQNPPELPDNLMLPIGVAVLAPNREVQTATVRSNLFIGLQQAIRAEGSQVREPGGPNPLGPHRLHVTGNRVIGSEELLEVVRKLLLAEGFGTFPDRARQAGSVVLVKTLHAHVADNDIAIAPIGVSIIDSAGARVGGNVISHCAAGVLCTRTNNASATDNTVEDASVVGVILLATSGSVVERNRITGAAIGITSTDGASTRLDTNSIRGGDTGILLHLEAACHVLGNTVEEAALEGIRSYLSRSGITLAHNHVARCGRREVDVMVRAIALDECDGTVNVESCQVIDTNSFTGTWQGISVNGPADVRVRSCTVAVRSDKAVVARDSRALLIVNRAAEGSRPACADATNNVFDLICGTPVLINTLHDNKVGEVMFSLNRCVNLGDDDGPTVQLIGSYLTVTGNRVQTRFRAASLRLDAHIALSAVGNMTTYRENITTTPQIEVPQPYPTYNANV